ncbi:MAG: PhnD/SsuA/transferrin family substrate-binding protein [Betaproteobacteria bacterium]
MDHRRRFITAAALAGSLPLRLRAQGGTVYRFSPVNQYGIELTARYWNPIIEYVSSKSGVRLELKIGRTSADTTAYVLANEVEFIFSNHMFSPEREQLGWKVIARRQTTPIQSQIVVLTESPIQKLEQLEGQAVAFPGPEATVAYKFSYAQLLKRNISVQVVFGGNMDGAFAQLVSGKVAAAGTHSQLSEGWSKRENRKVRALWNSEPLHDLAVMVARKVPQGDAEAVGRAFAGMLADPAGQRVLATVGELVKLPPSAGFVASSGTEYGPYRQFFATAPAPLR